MNSRHLLPLFLVLLPGVVLAQRHGDPLADPLPVADNAGYAQLDLAQLDLAVPPPPLTGPPPVTAPGGIPGADVSPSLPSTPRDAAPAAPTPGTIRLNFRNASLNDVLNYLSTNGGFIVVQQTPVTGTVTLNSQQPVTADEAVDALNTAMSDKGYVALRNGRILKIIARESAPKSGDLPVVVSADPTKIPRKDNMVTQILPVRYVEVGKLVDTLRPLLSDNATIASNDNANAVLLTDTQNNIHRIAEIIHALDSSVSSISVIRVYTLRYADAKELADVITQLFAPSGTTGGNGRNGQQQGGFPFGGFPFGGNRGGNQGGGAAAAPTSEARQAASRVIAVSDETTNSVVVSAPDEYMSAIDDLVGKLDTNTTEVTETQIFRLLHADANELASILTNLYSDLTTTSGAGGSGRNGQGQQQQNRFGPQQQQQQSSSGRSDRELLQARVAVVADPRTNSVLVNASHATMSQVALTIGRLDATDTRKQHVYVYTLGHADPDNVAKILQGMYSVSTTGSSSTTQSAAGSALSNRVTSGTTSDFSGSLGTNSSSGNRSGSSGGLR